MACLAMIPLSSSLASIGSTILFVYTAIRTPTIHATWRPLGRNACALLLVGLYLWLSLTLLWSSDPGHGARLLRGARYLLLVPALLPLLRHSNLLLGALCVGVLLQNVIQWFETDGTGGLSEHAGYAALWFTLVISILILMPSSGQLSTANFFRRTLALVPMFGIVLSTARSALLGCTGGLGLATAYVWLKRRGDRWQALAFSSLVLAFGIGLSFSPYTPINQGMQEAFEAAEAMNDPDVGSNPDLTRPLWWRIGLESLMYHPITGTGLGSAGTTIGNDEEVLDVTNDGTINLHAMRDDYHSLFVSVAAEGGFVGLALLLGWLGCMARQIIQSGRLDAVLLSGLVSFLAFSALNTTLYSGRLLAFAAILMAFSTVRIPTQSTVRDAVKEP